MTHPTKQLCTPPCPLHICAEMSKQGMCSLHPEGSLTSNERAKEAFQLEHERKPRVGSDKDSGWLSGYLAALNDSAPETKAPQEDKADLLAMAALVARKGRESLKADHKVEGEILLRAAEALHALAETRVTVPRSSAQETFTKPERQWRGIVLVCYRLSTFRKRNRTVHAAMLESYPLRSSY